METKVNRRVYAEDLETDMWVWNETQQEYQKVRYICVSKLGKYHWCDGSKIYPQRFLTLDKELKNPVREKVTY